jgi:hypothetical protein
LTLSPAVHVRVGDQQGASTLCSFPGREGEVVEGQPASTSIGVLEEAVPAIDADRLTNPVLGKRSQDEPWPCAEIEDPVEVRELQGDLLVPGGLATLETRDQP